MRPLLELPLADPIDTITMDVAWKSPAGNERSTSVVSFKVDAIAFQQKLTPASPDVDVLGRWSDGSAAVTRRCHGQGQAIAVGTAAGATYLKSGLLPLPWARGGRVNLYNPTDFTIPATRLAHLGVDAVNVERQVTCSNPFVESLILDNAAGTLLTLVNWTNQPAVHGLKVRIRTKAAPREVFSVTQQKAMPFNYNEGKVTLTTTLEAADYVLLRN